MTNALAIFGATGRTGRRLVRAALAEGYAVRALVRDPGRSDLDPAVALIPGDVLDPDAVARTLDGSLGALSTLGGGATQDPGVVRSQGMRTIVSAMTALGLSRVVALGGGGVLDATNGSGLRSEQPGYPEVFRRVTVEHRGAWEALRDSTLDWTYVCPPDIPDRDPTGNYRFLADVMPDQPKALANGDLAAFMLGEWRERRFSRKRVGICS